MQTIPHTGRYCFFVAPRRRGEDPVRVRFTHAFRDPVNNSAVRRTMRARLTSPLGEAVLVASTVTAIYLAVNLAAAISVGAFQDDGVYLVLGRALATGHGYRSIHLIGAPVEVKYPPGFPFILSIIWRVAPSIVAVQKIIGVLHPMIVGASIGMLWWLGRACFAASRSLLALFVLVPFLLDASVDYYTILLSEPWLIVGWALCLILWELAERQHGGRRRSLILALLGTAVATTALMRTSGVVLVPALLIALCRRPFTWRERALSAVASIAPLAVWSAWHRALIAVGPVSGLPDETSYLTWMHSDAGHIVPSLAGIVQANLSEYIDGFAAYFSGDERLGVVIATLWIGTAIVGTVLALWRQPFLALAGLGAVATVLLWPVAQDRFLLPILPFLGLATVGWCSRWSWARAGAGASIPAYAIGLLTAVIVMRQLDVRREALSAIVDSRRPAFFSPAYTLLTNSRFINNASRWVAYNTQPTDRVMMDHAAGIYLYSGRRTTPVKPAESPLETSVFAIPGRYLARRIVQDSVTVVLSADDAQPFLASGRTMPGILRDIDTIRVRCPNVLTWAGSRPSDGTYLYRIRRDDRCLAPLAR
jgi:hypothetical protein